MENYSKEKYLDYHFIILLLLEKEVIDLFVVRDLRELLLVHLGKVPNEGSVFLQHVSIQLHPRLGERIRQGQVN